MTIIDSVLPAVKLDRNGLPHGSAPTLCHSEPAQAGEESQTLMGNVDDNIHIERGMSFLRKQESICLTEVHRFEELAELVL